MEHVYGILLDQKFLYRSVHATFVNTKWYEAWLERTLLLDPIIFDMWGPGVLSWAPGQPCNSHHARHTGQDTLVVPCLRCGSFLYHKSVGGRGCGQQPDAFFHGFLARSAAATRRILGWSQRSSLVLVVSHAIALCVFRRVSPLLVYFRRVSPLLVFLFGFRRVSPLLLYFRRVPPLLVFFFFVSTVSRFMMILQCFSSQVFVGQNFLAMQCTLAAFVVGAGAQRCARLEEDASL